MQTDRFVDGRWPSISGLLHVWAWNITYLARSGPANSWKSRRVYIENTRQPGSNSKAKIKAAKLLQYTPYSRKAKYVIHSLSTLGQSATSEFWCKSKEEFHVALKRDYSERNRFDVTTPWQTKATISTFCRSRQHGFMWFGEVVIVLALNNWECDWGICLNCVVDPNLSLFVLITPPKDSKQPYMSVWLFFHETDHFI